MNSFKSLTNSSSSFAHAYELNKLRALPGVKVDEFAKVPAPLSILLLSYSPEVTYELARGTWRLRTEQRWKMPRI